MARRRFHSDTLRVVIDGRPSAVAAFLRWMRRPADDIGAHGHAPDPPLSPAELRVAELLGDGRTVAEIAAALDLEHNTIKTHVAHIYRKLSVRNRGQFLQWWNANK